MADAVKVLDTALWVNGLTDNARLNILVYLCGWKPELMATVKTEWLEAEDERITSLEGDNG